MFYCGIDISKLKFDAAIVHDGVIKTNTFNNTIAGIKSFYSWLKGSDHEIIFCMEATGIYSDLLAKKLHHSGYQLAVVNPIKTHNFSKLEMQRNKTDLIDSQMIARYCRYLWNESKFELNRYKPKSKYFEKLQYLFTRLDQLKKMQTQEKNRIEACSDKSIRRMLKTMLNNISKQIEQVERQIRLCQKQDKLLDKQSKLLTSIHGIGEITSWAILAYVGDVSLFNSSKQVTSFAGLNPRKMESGTSLKKSCLSKMGHRRLRRSLYMPALVAIKHNPVMLKHYEKLLAKGKPKKVAICAVMRKLLVVCYGVLKSGKEFDVNYRAQ